MESIDGYLRFADFKPHLKYLRKSYLYSIVGMLIAGAFIIPMTVIFSLIGLDALSGATSELNPFVEFLIKYPVILGLIVLLLLEILAIWWARLTYHALSYHLTRSEIVVKSGVIFKKDVTIPMRTITNIDMIIGPVDRMFGLSTLNIQTAGSVSILAEGRIVGLLKEDGEALRDVVKVQV